METLFIKILFILGVCLYSIACYLHVSEKAIYIRSYRLKNILMSVCVIVSIIFILMSTYYNSKTF